MLTDGIKDALICLKAGMPLPRLWTRRDYFFRRDGTALPPRIIYITLSPACNLKCMMCDIGSKVSSSTWYKSSIGDVSKRLRMQDLEKILDSLDPKITAIGLSGTEPLLAPNFDEFLGYAKSRGFQVQITTNGTLLKEHVDEIVEHQVDSLGISIVGPVDIHDKLRGVPGTYGKAMEGLKILLEARARERIKMRISVSVTVTPLNVKVLADFVKTLLETDIDSVTVSHLGYRDSKIVEAQRALDGGRWTVSQSAPGIFSPQDVDADELFHQLSILSDSKYSSRVKIIPRMDLSELKNYYYDSLYNVLGTGCFYPWIGASIASDGEVFVLPMCVGVSMGNVLEHGIQEIWNGEGFKNFRKWLRDNPAPPACLRCCSWYRIHNKKKVEH